MYVPKNPQPRINKPINGGGASKTVEEVSNLSQTKSDPLIDKGTLLDSPSVLARLISENPPKMASCTIEDFFDDLDDGLIENT